MKQRKHNQKIQNWHRPLSPRQVGRWYRRHRDDTPPDYIDDDCLCWDDDDWASEQDTGVRQLELRQLLRDVFRPLLPLFLPEWSMDAVLRSEEAGVCRNESAESIDPLEERLATFVQNITHFPTSPATRQQILDAIGDDVCLDVRKGTARHLNGEHLLQNVFLFAPFWIRSPRTWPGGNASLIEHLFVRYDVPGFLYPEWTKFPDGSNLKWLCWFILLAQGGSLRRAARLFDWDISNRYEHFLRIANAGNAPSERCTAAEIMRLGGSVVDCRRVLSNPAFVIDPTDTTNNEGMLEFWSATIRWLIAHSAALTDEQSEQVLSWAMHEYTEAVRNRTAPFCWKGRGLTSTLQRSGDYRTQIERPWSRYAWKGHGWDWTPVDLSVKGWSFVELTSGEMLFREGQAMRHCVSGYAARCAEDACAVVSMRLNETRQVTLEVIPATGFVIQARGVCNRPATQEELRVVRRWVNTIVRPGQA